MTSAIPCSIGAGQDAESQEMLDRVLCADAGVPYVPRSERDMSERELSSRVRRMTDERQLWGHCSYDYRHRSGSGWVDWVIISQGGVLFRELKTRGGSLTPQQRFVGQMLRYFGHDWAVWTPDELIDGTIARQLDAVMAQDRA
jgi:hypothetical protein